MRLPTSSEFITLCQSQVMVLTQGFGASLSIVYITDEMADELEPRLVPVVAYPEAAMDWDAEQVLAVLTRQSSTPSSLKLLPSDARTSDARTVEQGTAIASYLSDTSSASAPPPLRLQPSHPGIPNHAQSSALLQDTAMDWQVVLPLVHEGTVIGLLVTARTDRPWDDPERTQIERVARTLAIARILDQRSHWLDHDLQQQRLLQSQQHDVLDTLLHQFRNPLTAMRTFGKLLLKRLIPGDSNRDLAEGIVRESDRLQELLQEFDTAIDLGSADLIPAANSPTPSTWAAQIPPEDVAQTVSTKPMLLPGAGYLGGAELQLTPHPLMDIVQPLLQSAEAIAQDRQLTLITDLESALPPVQIDAKALREVLSNLIDNALKYTPAGGQVYLAVRRYASIHQQTVVIADTGPGIPSQDLAHLFERHYRGVQASTEIPGTGLGLAIARDLVVQMHGEIQVFSPAIASGLLGSFQASLEASQHQGTAVIVWLPDDDA